MPAQEQRPPARAYPGRSPLWPSAVAVLTVAVTAASYWMGTYLAVYGRTGINFYLLIALVGATSGTLVAIWSDTAYQLHTWGSDLFGKTALGWRRVDLANLTSAKLETFGQRSSVKLGDSRGRIVVPGKKLPPIIDSVRRGVSEAAERGEFVVSQRLAVQLGLPVQEGASKGGTGNILLAFGVLGLIGFGLILGAAVAS